MFAARGGRLSSSGPSPNARLHELEVREARQAEAPPEHEPDDELQRRAAPRASPSPRARATSASEPIVAWLNRGARESITVRVAVRIREALVIRVRYASISTSATSGRENSTGGSSPAASISRTFVPLRKT